MKLIKIDGDFKPDDIEELEKIYFESDVNIDNSNKYSNALIGDIDNFSKNIIIYFQDFDVYKFTLDLFFSNLLMLGIEKAKYVIKHFRNQKTFKNPDLTFEFNVELDKKLIKIIIEIKDFKDAKVLSEIANINLNELIHFKPDISLIKFKYIKDWAIEIE